MVVAPSSRPVSGGGARNAPECSRRTGIRRRSTPPPAGAPPEEAHTARIACRCGTRSAVGLPAVFLRTGPGHAPDSTLRTSRRASAARRRSRTAGSPPGPGDRCRPFRRPHWPVRRRTRLLCNRGVGRELTRVRARWGRCVGDRLHGSLLHPALHLPPIEEVELQNLAITVFVRPRGRPYPFPARFRLHG